MSVRIKTSELTPRQCQAIGQFLNFELSRSFLERKYSQESKWFQAYFCDSGYTYLPFKFSQALGFQLPSANGERFDFKGQLRETKEEDQITVAQTAIKHLEKDKTCILNLKTGFGKTYEGIFLSAHFSPTSSITIVVIHLTGLINNWKDYYTASNARVWIVEDGGSGKPPSKPQVIIAMIDRIHYIPEAWRTGAFLIIDEAHSLCTPDRYPKLLQIHPAYVLALTATTNREDGAFKALQAMAGFETLIMRELNRKMVVDELGRNVSVLAVTKPIRVIRYHTNFEPEIPLKKDGTPNWSEYVNTLDNNDIRSWRVLNQLQFFRDRKAMIFYRHSLRIETYRLTLKDMGTHATTFYGSDRNYEDAPVLLSTLPKTREGFDQKNTALKFDGLRINLIIIWNHVKNLLALAQLVGRGLRAEDLIVIYLIDKTSMALNHYIGCENWLREHGATFTDHYDPPIPKIVRAVNLGTGQMVNCQLGKS